MRRSRIFVVIATAAVAFAVVRRPRAEPSKPEDAAYCLLGAPNTCGSGAHCDGRLAPMLHLLAAGGATGTGTGSATACTADFKTLTGSDQARCVAEFLNTEAGACQQVAALTSDLADRMSAAQKTAAGDRLTAANDAAAHRYRCASQTVLCLDPSGELILGSTTRTVDANDKLTVVVLSPHAADVGAVTIDLRGTRSLDSLVRTSATKPAKLHGPEPRTFELFEIASAVFEPGEDTHAVEVSVTRGTSTKRREIRVNHGRYFVELGLEIPFVYRGNRTLTSQTVVSEHTEPRAAISAIIFFWGRPKDRIGYEGTRAENFGLQIGTDFDFTKDLTDKDYHLGIAFEPIAGFGLGAGISFVKGEFVPAGPEVPPLGDMMIRRDERYMLRPYVSIFMTTKFIDAARATISDLGK